MCTPSAPGIAIGSLFLRNERVVGVSVSVNEKKRIRGDEESRTKTMISPETPFNDCGQENRRNTGKRTEVHAHTYTCARKQKKKKN